MKSINVKTYESQPLSSSVYDQILHAIIEGNYAVNAKLPTEEQLSRIHQVSRPVLREALARLREDKLIVSKRGSGSYVIKKPAEAVLQFGQLSSIADIQRCFEFRTNLEAEAASFAAKRRSAEQLEKIISAYEALDIANASTLLATDEDFLFHLAVTEAANNHFFSTVLKSLEKSIKDGINITRNLSLQHPKSRLELVQCEHMAILEAIRLENSDAAKHAMQNHLNNARTRMFEGSPD